MRRGSPAAAGQTAPYRHYTEAFKSYGFFGLVLFSIVGLAILAFGSAQYQGPAALRHDQ
jgi:hypothetical protein